LTKGDQAIHIQALVKDNNEKDANTNHRLRQGAIVVVLVLVEEEEEEILLQEDTTCSCG